MCVNSTEVLPVSGFLDETNTHRRSILFGTKYVVRIVKERDEEFFLVTSVYSV